MNKSKLNALAQISAVAGGRYNSLIIEDTRNKLLHLLSTKFVNSDYEGASKDIERIVLIDTKKDGYEAMLSLINDVKENNDRSKKSLIILNGISEYDRSKTIKKNLKSFKFPKKENGEVPHSIKVLFGSGEINMEDIQKHASKIKEVCHLTDDFFVKAVQANSKFNDYGTQINQPHQIQSQFLNIPNPYQNLQSNASCQVILPPAPNTPSLGARTYSLPQYYTNNQYQPSNPPFQPPIPPTGPSYY